MLLALVHNLRLTALLENILVRMQKNDEKDDRG